MKPSVMRASADAWATSSCTSDQLRSFQQKLGKRLRHPLQQLTAESAKGAATHEKTKMLQRRFLSLDTTGHAEVVALVHPAAKVATKTQVVVADK